MRYVYFYGAVNGEWHNHQTKSRRVIEIIILKWKTGRNFMLPLCSAIIVAEKNNFMSLPGGRLSRLIPNANSHHHISPSLVYINPCNHRGLSNYRSISHLFIYLSIYLPLYLSNEGTDWKPQQMNDRSAVTEWPMRSLYPIVIMERLHKWQNRRSSSWNRRHPLLTVAHRNIQRLSSLIREKEAIRH